MKIKFKKFSDEAVMPKKAHVSDAGFDLTCVGVPEIEQSGAGFKITYSLGIGVEIPQGYVGLIFPRSSVHKTNMVLSNCVGVVDSGYRGEIKAVFYARHLDDNYKRGDRVCQLIIMPYPEIEFEEVEELNDSDRGANGYGSTGR